MDPNKIPQAGHPSAGLYDGQESPADPEATAPFVTDPPPSGEPTHLEANGYATVRDHALSAVERLGSMHPTALEEAIAFNARAVRRLEARPELNAVQQQALENARIEGRYLELVRRMRKDLERLQERIRASAIVTAR